MILKIRYDGECEKFCKILWELNKAFVFVWFWVHYARRVVGLPPFAALF